MNTAEWALLVSILAGGVALLAAGFAGWQALTAHWARLADNEGTLVEWAEPEWVSAGHVEIRSNEPDVARRVWGRFNVEGKRSERRACRVQPGSALDFEISGQQVSWDWHARQEPSKGEQSQERIAFNYGGLLTWRNRYGKRFSLPIAGYVRRQVRDNPEPYPHEADPS